MEKDPGNNRLIKVMREIHHRESMIFKEKELKKEDISKYEENA